MAVLVIACSGIPNLAAAYSVFAHEAVVDAAWQDQLVPALERRFPGATSAELDAARAYAYGGSLIQDLGYYPFGSRLFSNLVHYVRSGDFVEALIRDARNVDEYAFALGALAHYTSDTLGHPIAVNRAVPLVYPKLHAKYGDDVLYVESPARHLMVEFAFDVVQVAQGRFKSDVYQQRIGFEVATSVLERAFRETYGLELGDLFGDTDLAIGTYRRAVSTVIPDMTRLAWKEKRDEILEATPDIAERDVVYSMTRREYEEAYGVKYRKPGLFARFVVMVFKVIPKFGPFKPLAFEPLTSEATALFTESFAAATARYRDSLRALRSRPLPLNDVDLDTGKPVRRGANPLADETYADLLKKLAATEFADVPPALRADINEHFASAASVEPSDRKTRKQEREAARRLAALNGVAAEVR
jgi:zinc dependent phospholipase C